MKQIIVEPGRLTDTASRIEQANMDYERLYQSLYAEVDKMSEAWQGKDNVAFSTQIRTFEKDLRSISIIMRQYAEFLRNSAQAYQDTQDEIYSQASRLRS